MNSHRKWFSRLAWLGILVNLPFGILGLFAPDVLTALANLESVPPTFWTRDAGLFLIMISLFYVPGALDPFRYRVNAWLLVIGRFVYVVFWSAGVCFLDFPRATLNFAIVDLVLGMSQGIFLVLMFRAELDRAN
ncbi:MAG: hypothetical protein MJE77_28720 [Proteobacteria bacterium]|nr:hypothetical protein [Pseudomonadota bacterium]